MGQRQSILRRGAVVLAGFVLAATGTTPPAGASPGLPVPPPITRPGGLLPDAAAVSFGDCARSGVTCKPSGTSRPSCTGNTSQTTTPKTIKVYVPSASTKIQTINFETYVENSLPNEWVPSWDGDALKAGAVAIKSYAWYWITHFGGYLNGNQNSCFDVTDDTNFQVYRANSATTRTTTAVQQSWPVAARMNGRVLQASYIAYLHSSSEACGTYANGYQLSQWGTQNCNRASSAYKYNLILGKYYFPGLQLAPARQLRTQHDFRFQQSSTRVVFHSGKWAIDDGYPTNVTFGVAGDLPTVTTNGDGFGRVGVFRPSTSNWYVATPTGRVAVETHFGVLGDMPTQAQYSGVDKPTVLSVFRPSNSAWYLATAAGRVAQRTKFGLHGDIPVPGRYFGTAANHYADTIAVFRPSEGRWYFPGHPPVRWGIPGDIPMPADYDGNGSTDLAVYRPSNNRFYLRGLASVQYGHPGDIPVTGDFTGDGKADLAVYRPTTHAWYAQGISAHIFGASGDVPIGRAPYHD